jgi:DNA-directed RNA polymerase subunit N (RpoN/RPB10)
MIIPVRCVSCNNVLAGKWLAYLEKVRELTKDEKLTYLTQSTVKSPHGKALDELGVIRTCCRRHLLTHVDL